MNDERRNPSVFSSDHLSALSSVHPSSFIVHRFLPSPCLRGESSFLLILLTLLSIAATKPDLLTTARKGESLTEDQASKLQAGLQKSPDDAELRAQLLGFDLGRKADVRLDRLTHILWMID